MSNSNRREFLKSVGQGSMAAALYMHLPDGAWLTTGIDDVADPGAASGVTYKETKLECDVLIIGGGFAGEFAAIKAKEQGASVVLVNKGYTGKSGMTPSASGFLCFNPEWGHKFDDWMAYTNKCTEYVNNRTWTEIVFKESYPRYKDLVSYGVGFKMKDGKLLKDSSPLDPFEMISYANNARFEVYDPETNHAAVLRRYCEKIGVKIVDRVMVTELLKQKGRIVGAAGVSVDGDNMYTFVAKTTVMAAGPGALKPAGYPMLVQLTADSEAMAYRAGAELLGKEFCDVHVTRRDSLPICARAMVSEDNEVKLGREKPLIHHGFIDNVYDVDGQKMPDRPAGSANYKFSYLGPNFLVHEGKAPLEWKTEAGDKEIVGGACLGLSHREAEGIWPANTDCASTVPGLYAAGDALGSMTNGAVYSIGGTSSGGATVTGARAGTAAGKEAMKISMPVIDEKELARAKLATRAPRDRKGGYSPRWVTQHLQNVMMPNFVSYIKKADRLENALAQVEYMQAHLVPWLYAGDPHELRLAHETRNMVFNAELVLRSSLFRTESRGNHYREDFPRRDDKNWLAWTKVRQEQGKMVLVKVPVPDEWHPDPSIPYEKRYPFRFPGE